MNPWIQQKAIGLFLVALACFALSPIARALLPPPPPDGGYPNRNTAEGDNALFNVNDVGSDNTALGFKALFRDTFGSSNTAIGSFALTNNIGGGGNVAIGLSALRNNTSGGNGNVGIGNFALQNNRTGLNNTAIGTTTLLSNNGNLNTAIGAGALQRNTTGSQNTATGWDALLKNTTASNNTANGFQALFNNTTGQDNTATGTNALFSNMDGISNTANGVSALQNNTTGSQNTATGISALELNTTGRNNTANGCSALELNTTGGDNTAIGFRAMFENDTGGFNTAVGHSALQHNFAGNENTATGVFALDMNETGSENTADGHGALFRNIAGNNNTAIGVGALGALGGSDFPFPPPGNGNIALGFNAGANLTTGNSNIDIGNRGVDGDSATIRIGVQGTQNRTFVAGISGSPITGTSVVVNSFGRLGTVASSQRFKDDIKPMDKASETIHALKPVTFRYKPEMDPEGVPQFGLVAEDVEKVIPAMVVRDKEGKPYSVRYEAVNAMLLNEFLKEHSKVEKLETTVARQQKQIEALTAGLQKVSDQFELSKSASQTAMNNE